MSGSPFLNQIAKLEHENDLLRDSYEEVSAHLEAMAKMRDTLKVELTKALEQNCELRKECQRFKDGWDDATIRACAFESRDHE